MTSAYHAIELSYILPCYYNQENHDSLNKLLADYATFSPALLDRIQFVIVDDCSPLEICIPPELDLNLLHLRIDTDIAWNQGGARNLGVVYARSDKVIATDADHFFPEPTLERIVSLPRLGKRMYKPARRLADGSAKDPHPNTFIMSRGRFLEFFGVDEEFSGHYGYEDGMFWRWQRYNGTRFASLGKRYPIYVRDIDQGKSYHSLGRDKQHNAGLRASKLQSIADYGYQANYSRTMLNFTWHIKEDRKRQQQSWQQAKDIWWKRLWWWRRLGC